MGLCTDVLPSGSGLRDDDRFGDARSATRAPAGPGASAGMATESLSSRGPREQHGDGWETALRFAPGACAAEAEWFADITHTRQ
ncbi:hypothetical protein Sm713_54310 [Streptomyces sp. TS71-3]|nr:hypothetical protein Sm713_54310 [Streptomyces sp. TS71-3]